MFRPFIQARLFASRHRPPITPPRPLHKREPLALSQILQYAYHRKEFRRAVTYTIATVFAATVAFYTSDFIVQRRTDAVAKRVLSPQDFHAYRIAAKRPVSATSALFGLEPSVGPDEDEAAADTANRAVYETAFRAGVWSVEFKQPHMQIARAYTPIPMGYFGDAKGVSRMVEAKFQAMLWFLIRREKDGEVSGYLHGLREGEEVEVRGPTVEWRVPERVRNVVFLAGGTGIAPALQVAACLIGRKREEVKGVKLHILWANRRRDDCRGSGGDSYDPAPVVGLLEALKVMYPNEISVQYFVDDERTFIDEKALGPLLGKQHVGSSDENIVLISGPDGFVDHYAGQKAGYNNGELQQGGVGGVLGRLNLEGWSVWKL